jgi:imidazole glycerol-phosphate synthase subunit HisH
VTGDGVVAIVDLGMGNLYNVERACQHVGLPCAVTPDPADLPHAAGIILPGVGAFRNAMTALDGSGMSGALRAAVSRGVPLLGICLGFQLLFTEGEEFGLWPGLGLVEGRVERLRPGGDDAGGFKVPQIGWNAVHPPAQGAWEGTLLADVPPGTSMYFMHSYAVKRAADGAALARTQYGRETFISAAARGPVLGVQFHPELSGPPGVGIYRRFALRTGRRNGAGSRPNQSSNPGEAQDA